MGIMSDGNSKDPFADLREWKWMESRMPALDANTHR